MNNRKQLLANSLQKSNFVRLTSQKKLYFSILKYFFIFFKYETLYCKYSLVNKKSRKRLYEALYTNGKTNVIFLYRVPTDLTKYFSLTISQFSMIFLRKTSKNASFLISGNKCPDLVQFRGNIGKIL